MVARPATESELLSRARALSGRNLAWVAASEHAVVPPDLRRNKGWIGNLLETALGATSSSRPQPDFPHLGIELKTLPVDERGKPRETTYVCTAPLDGTLSTSWESSWVRRKLSAVLWVPIVGAGPPGERIVGSPFLWRPTAEDDAALGSDFAAIAEIIARGEWWNLDARHGAALHVRPKAANAQQMVWVLDEEASWVRTNPRGFYLRTRFTETLVRRYLLA